MITGGNCGRGGRPVEPPQANVIAFPTVAQGPHGVERYLSKTELAQVLGVSVSFINKHMRESALPFFKVAGAVRFKLSEVEAWISRCRS